MTDSKQTFATLKELIRMHSVQTSRQALIIRSMWQFAAFPYFQAIRKAGKHQNNNLFFKSALLISTVSTSAFQSTNLLLFASHHISTFNVAPFFPYKHTQPTIPPSAPTKGQRSKCQFCNSLRWPIYAINSIDNT